MKHTPTPWTNKDDYGRPTLCVWSKSEDAQLRRVGGPVANCEQFDAAEEDKANAAFIVEAANNHERMENETESARLENARLTNAIKAQAKVIAGLHRDKEALLKAANAEVADFNCYCHKTETPPPCTICSLKEAIALCGGGVK